MVKFLAVLLLFSIGLLRAQNVFHSISINTTEGINDIIVDDDGNVWASTNNGIWKRDLFSQSLTFFDSLNGITGLPVYDLSMDASGDVFLSGAKKTVSKWDEQLGAWATINLTTSKSFSYFTHVYHASNSTIYFGTDNGLVFTKATGSAILQEKTQYTSAHNLGAITSISQTSNSAVTAILSTNGIVLDLQGYILPVTAASLLPSDSVISGLMYRDISYDGTTNGLYVADFSSGAPPSVFTFNTNNSSLPSNRITALAAYGDTLFVGTDQGLAIYDLISHNWHIINSSNSNLPSNAINKLTVSKTGRLWIVSGTNNLSTWANGIGISEVNIGGTYMLVSNIVKQNIRFSGWVKNSSYTVFDSSGGVVLKGKVILSSDQVLVTSLSPGLYMIVLQDKNGQVYKEKFLKE